MSEGWPFMTDKMCTDVNNVLKSGKRYLKIDTIKNLLNVFKKEKRVERRLSIALNMLNVYKKGKNLPGLLHYVAAKCYDQLNKTREGKKHLLQSLKLVRKSNLIFYKANELLGDIAERKKRITDMANYYSSAVNNYELHMNEPGIRRIARKLIEYYEEYGERAESQGDYKGASGSMTNM